MRWWRFVAVVMLCASGWMPGWGARAWGSVIIISGTVQDSLGNGIAGVQVTARWRGGGRSCTTDNRGLYTFTGMPSTVTVVVAAAAIGDLLCTFEPASYTFSELVESLTDVNFVGTIYYTVRGRTITLEGQAIANVTISAYARAGDMGEWTLWTQTTTDGNGQYSIVLPQHWTGKICASRDGYVFIGPCAYLGIESSYENQDFKGTPAGYTLTVNATNGSVTRSPDKAMYDSGETVALTATPDPHHHFVNWTTDGPVTIGDPNLAGTTATVNGDGTVTAHFAPDRKVLTVSHSGAGSVVLPGEGQFYADYGTVLNLQAVPADPNSEFGWWTGTAVDQRKVWDPRAFQTTVLVDENYTLRAVFVGRTEGPTYSFSIGEIDADGADQFTYRLATNNTPQALFVERVTGARPDPNGMIRMRTVEGRAARAKGRFGQCTGDKVLVRFDYLFENSSSPEMVVYLSDVPQLMDPRVRLHAGHYVEVGRVLPPPAGRPGAVGSGPYGQFEQWVSTAGLDLSAGVYVELELIHYVPADVSTMGLVSVASASPEEVLVDNWCAGVCCGICLDLDWSQGVNVKDYLVLPSLCGRAVGEWGSFCLEGAFGADGFIDRSELDFFDWMLDCDTCKNFCGASLPLSLAKPPILSAVATSTAAGTMGLPGDLAILGKRSPAALVGMASGVSIRSASDLHAAAEEEQMVQDRVYALGSDATFAGVYEPAGFINRQNVRLIRSDAGRLYVVNSRLGLLDLKGRTVVGPGGWQGVPEPRYGKTATVSIGVQGNGTGAFGRPMLDAVIRGTEAYVVPAVVTPAGQPSYLAAVKLSLVDGTLLRIYDDPDPSITHSANVDNPNLLGLREIEVDGGGNVYVLNVARRNSSTMLWKYSASPSAAPQRVELDGLGIVDPVGLCLAQKDAVLYVASGQCDWNDPNAVRLYRLSTGDLSLQKTLRLGGMYSVTDIAEQGPSGWVWVAGYGLDPVLPEVCGLLPPKYRPVLAHIEADDQVVVTNLAGRADDLALPTSVVWVSGR